MDHTAYEYVCACVPVCDETGRGRKLAKVALQMSCKTASPRSRLGSVWLALGGGLPLRAFHLATCASLPGGGESAPCPSAASSASNSEQPVWITSASCSTWYLELGLGKR